MHGRANKRFQRADDLIIVLERACQIPALPVATKTLSQSQAESALTVPPEGHLTSTDGGATDNMLGHPAMRHSQARTQVACCNDCGSRDDPCDHGIAECVRGTCGLFK